MIPIKMFPDTIRKTHLLARRKDIRDTYHKNRTPLLRYAHVFRGDLAKNIVCAHAESVGQKIENFDLEGREDIDNEFDFKANTLEYEVKNRIHYGAIMNPKNWREAREIMDGWNISVSSGQHVTNYILQTYYAPHDTKSQMFLKRLTSHNFKKFCELCGVKNENQFCRKFVTNVRYVYVAALFSVGTIKKAKSQDRYYTIPASGDLRERKMVDLQVRDGEEPFRWMKGRI